MDRLRRHGAIAGLLACVLVIWGCSTSAQREEEDRPGVLPRPLAEALNWLPSDTETVLVYNGPFRCEGLDPEVDSLPAPLPRYDGRRGGAEAPGAGRDGRGIVNAPDWLARQLRVFSLGPLVDASRHLEGLTVSFTMEGSRRFRGSSGLGMMPYEGAHIVAFRDDPGPAGLAFMDSIRKGVASVEILEDHEVIELERRDGTDSSMRYVTRPRADVIVWATAREALREVLGRMARGGEGRALPPGSPEWRFVDPTTPIWAIRHYDRRGAADDPSSPLAGRRAEANVPDDRAIGLTVTLRPGDGVLRSIYLSGSEDAVAIAGERWGALGQYAIVPDVRPDGPGVVRTSIPLGGIARGSAWGLLLLTTLEALGHGVAL